MIVGVDFLQRNGLVLDFSSSPVKICSNSTSSFQMPNKTVASVYHPQYQPAAQVSIITDNCSQTANIRWMTVQYIYQALGKQSAWSFHNVLIPARLAVIIRKFNHLFRTSPAWCYFSGVSLHSYRGISSTGTTSSYPYSLSSTGAKDY